MAIPDNTATLLVNGLEMTGWNTVRVSRGLDRIPSDFDISLTERNPTNASLLSIEPAMSCQLNLGSDPVITGWIDRVVLSVGPRSHTVRVMGRSLCEDLTDSHITPAILTGNQIFTSSLLDLATRLASQFNQPAGIPVRVATGVNTALLSSGAAAQVNAILTETPWEVLERVARSLGVLLYDMPDGSLMIANVGTSSMQTGFGQGAHVQAASVSYSVEERFSVYLPSLMSTNFFGQQAVGSMKLAPVTDNFAGAVTRYRPRIVVSEQFQADKPLAERRAKWEAARRYGRSQAVRLTCDNWRDKAGTLWTPNAFAPLYLPALKLTPSQDWVIGNVTYIKDAERGTVADVVMMPQQAFQPEPEILLPFLYDPTATPLPGATALPPT